MDLYKYHNKSETLKGHHEANDIVPDRVKKRIQIELNIASNESEDVHVKLTPKQENTIAKDPDGAYWYARYIVKGPWPKGEKAIATNGLASLQYAHYVLRKPFPAGEKAILKNYQLTIDYAIDVLKQPWPEGEPTILSGNVVDAYSYVNYFFHSHDMIKNKSLKKFEDLFATDEWVAFAYAKTCLKRRFLKGEPIIATDDWYKKHYEEMFHVQLS